MEVPSLFSYATGELAQDAFICWLAKWADPKYRAEHRPLHDTATAFLNRLLEFGELPKPSEYKSVQVERQYRDIDILLLVNDDIAVIIEDKTDTRDHSGQLNRYKATVATAFPDRRACGVYLKTGDQGNYQSVVEAKYGQFLRRDFLTVLDCGERSDVKNDIYAHFHGHLRQIEADVQSFQTVPVNVWGENRHPWTGFFLALQNEIPRGDWKYVSNPRRGFMGFTWHWRENKFLQLEAKKLCFKIMVPDKAQGAAKWLEWHDALMAVARTTETRLLKPNRRQPGRCMSVAVLAASYLQQNDQGLLYFAKTVAVLREAEALMDRALQLCPAPAPAERTVDAL